MRKLHAAMRVATAVTVLIAVAVLATAAHAVPIVQGNTYEQGYGPSPLFPLTDTNGVINWAVFQGLTDLPVNMRNAFEASFACEDRQLLRVPARQEKTG